jgi:hypothetical protein
VSLALPSIFPDETDFRTLMTLPLSRRTIFSAKCTAVLLFASIFSTVSYLGFGAPFTLVSHGRWAQFPLATRLGTHLVATMAACAFTVLAIVAIQGLLLALAPRRWLQRLSVVVQTLLIGAVVLSLPLVARAPTLWSSLPRQPGWLLWVPSAWFLGLQEWLLGNRDEYFTRLAAAALAGIVVAAVLTGASYAIAYARFDQTVLRQAIDRATPKWNVTVPPLLRYHPCYEAIRQFTAATLYRSGVHQLVFGGAIAAGLALAIDRLLASVNATNRWFQAAVIATPLTLMAGASVGLRLALLLPTNIRAGWIFRFTENQETRRYSMDAVRWTLFRLGVSVPTLLAAPLFMGTLGVRNSVASLPVVLLLGWILTEMLCIDWRRIPFTCTILFAKHPPAYTILIAILIFGWFVFLGRAVVDVARSGVRPWCVVVAVLAAAGGALSWYRHLTWGRLPLEFEDYLPDDVHPLRLGP